MKESIIDLYHSALSELCSYGVLTAYAQECPKDENLFVLSIGKAAWQMAQVLGSALCRKGIPHRGIVLTKYQHSRGSIPGMIIMEAGHPLPDENSILHTESILRTLESLSPETRLVILLSGGGSALFEKPLGLSLEELRSQSLALQNSGIGIQELNRWRIQHSAVKGGKALCYIACRRIEAFLVSDIKDNPPELIASGPFYGNNKADGSPVEHRIVADNLTFRKLLAEKLHSAGYAVELDETFFDLTAEAMAQLLTGKLEALNQESGLIILGGECPVEVNGSGSGGRCTHLALLMAERLAGRTDIGFLALATDGTDGPTDAAGAWVDGATAARVTDLEQSIHQCDSYHALQRAGALIKTGGTGSNVNDVYVIFRVGNRC